VEDQIMNRVLSTELASRYSFGVVLPSWIDKLEGRRQKKLVDSQIIVHDDAGALHTHLHMHT
jgi:hypothetical protein